MMNDFVAVGERAHEPNKTTCREWERTWNEIPLGGMLNGPAFTGGPTSRRLAAMLPMGCRKVNLLAPSPVAGEWHAPTAAFQARVLRDWAIRTSRDLIFLGRRVATAFGVKSSLLTCGVDCDGLRFLVLPHPSGRSRFLNDAKNWARIGKAVSSFLDGNEKIYRLQLVASDATSYLDEPTSGAWAALLGSVAAWEASK
jgi:hypothetical protein